MDILEKDGAITADRPRAIAGGEMISGNMRLLLVRAGEHFRKLRKHVFIFHIVKFLAHLVALGRSTLTCNPKLR